MDVHLYGSTRRWPDDLLLADQYTLEPGGKGANQARAAARLGAGAMLVGRVGDDPWGETCVQAVRADGVDTSHVSTSENTRTGLTVIDIVDGIHVTRVVVPSANSHLSQEDVEHASDALERCDAILTQAEVPRPVRTQLAAWCSEVGIPLYLDPSPADSVTDDLLAASEVVTPNLDEAGRLADVKIEGEESARSAATIILSRGAQRVVVKLDDSGSLFADRDHVELVPTLDAEAVDETGAGDVFIAALAVAKLSGDDWLEAVRYANFASALSVQGIGLHLPDRQAVGRAMGEPRGAG